MRCGSLCVAVLSLTLLLPCVPARCHPVRRTGAYASKTAPPEPVDLNEASETELKMVPGITARTAQKIVEGRPYGSVSDLAKAGVPASTIKRIRKNVTVAGPVTKPQRSAAEGEPAGMVWVRTGSKVYHQPGDKWYGRTKDGRYMTEKDAIAAGYRPSKER